MLTKASIEALRTKFDASDLDGTESIYAARCENDVAFVAIASDGNLKTYKSDGYPDDLLEQEIMTLCCSQYDNKLTHIPLDLNGERFETESSGSLRIIVVELLVALIVMILGAIFLLIYWVLFRNLQTVLIIGGIICLPVIFYIIPKVTAQSKINDK